MIQHYDRDGQRISKARWRELKDDQTYVQVAHDVIDDDAYLSTIWVGYDLEGFRPDHAPMIFESMWFVRGSGNAHFEERGCRRHATEGAAVTSHKLLLQAVKAERSKRS